MQSKKIITVIGSLNTDLVTKTPRIPSGGETLTATSFSTGPGGKGANQAVACARLSRPNPKGVNGLASVSESDSRITVKMVGAVGKDEFGPSLIESMGGDGIDTSGVELIEGMNTGVAVILVESATGENRILLNPGANHSHRPSDFLTSESLGSPLPDLIIMQLEIPLPTVLGILETAERAGVHVLLNPAPAVVLPDQAYKSITHLIVNETEAAILTGRSVEEVEEDGFAWDAVTDDFIEKGVKNVVVTLGSKGAFYSHGKGGHHVEAERVERVVDTTAAGDTFVGAYAVNIVRGLDVGEVSVTEDIVRQACKAAARTVEKLGAQTAIPWADEVERKR